MFTALLKLFKENVRVEEYLCHYHATLLNIVLFLKVFFEEFLLCCIGIENAAKCFVAIASLWLCRGNKLLGIGCELLLKQSKAVRLGYENWNIDGCSFHDYLC